MTLISEIESEIYKILYADITLRNMLAGGKISKKVKPLNSLNPEVVIIGITSDGSLDDILQRFLINVNLHLPITFTNNEKVIPTSELLQIGNRLTFLVADYYSRTFNMWVHSQNEIVLENEIILNLVVKVKKTNKL